MDTRTFNINSANELRLRRHIREVLLPYVRVHLTSDHVAFTEKAVEELLLQTLAYVPMADATSIFLPTDPFEHLMRSLDSVDLTLPEERWSTPMGHVTYLRILFPPLNPRDLRTEKCWHEEDNHLKLALMCKPVSSPILSKRAVRETPKPGATDYRASIPCSHSSLTAYLGLDMVPAQSIEDLPILPVDDILDLRFKLDHATGSRARPLLESVLVPSMKGKFVDCFEDTPNVPKFLNHQSPPQRVPSLDSPPLFPRVVQRCSTHGGIRGDANSGISNPTRFPDLISMVQDASSELIDSEDGDINGHHMKVVSGWSTLTFSSPPPRSPCSSDGSGVDELWNMSPSGTPGTSLMAAKMDEVEIPRIRKFGHKNLSANERANTSDNADLLPAAKCPGFFITSFISAPIPMAQAQSITPQLEGVKSGMHPPHPLLPGQNTSDSLLGQPPSISGEQASEKTSATFANFVEDFRGQPFDDAVASIYVSAPQDPLFYIREEKLDDKDIMLMDVPTLPSPTAHTREPTLFPKGMRTFVAPTNELGRPDVATLGTNGFCLTSFLRPVKGVKNLALDLSWRPFNFGKTIPTDEDVIGIAKAVQPEDEVPGYLDEKYKARIQILLDLPPTSAEEAQLALIPSIPRGCEAFGASPTPKRTEEIDRTMYLLTHRERLRASSAKISFGADNRVQDDLDTEQHITQWSQDDGHQDIPIQDQSLPQYEEHQSPRISFGLPKHDRPTFDDSGVDIMDSSVGHSTSGLFSPHLPAPLRVDPLCDANALQGNTGEDKENVPPLYVGDYQATGDQPDSLEKQDDWSCYFEFPASETPPFEPLSFVSQSQFLESSDGFANSKVQDVPAPTLNGDRVKRLKDDLIPTGGPDEANSRLSKRRKLGDLVSASPRDLFSTFIGLRNQVVSSTVQDPENRNDARTPYQTSDTPNQMAPRAAPDDIFDQHTVHLPEHWIPAAVLHRYLVSMNVIQKRALVRELQGHHCRVTLVERCDLGGTDIIIDPDFGVLFVPLLALPANVESTVERISGESWRYLNLLAVFEAFPSAQSYRADHSQNTRPTPYAYTPPICKAIKKLRRNLGIAEGCGTMNLGCTVTWAFANDVEEAARFVRCFGEEACTVSMERGYGIQWDDREWLEEEEREGESILASVHGMNAFAAFVMLYNKSLDIILDLSPEDRLAEFGHLLGKERMIGLNAVIESRLQQITPDTADSIVDPGY